MKTHIILSFCIILISSNVFSQSIFKDKTLAEFSEIESIKDSIGKYNAFADLHKQKARANERKIYQAKKVLRLNKKIADKIISQYELFKKNEDSEFVKKLKIRAEKAEEIINKLAQMIPNTDYSEKNYQKEAFYREKIIEHSSKPSIANLSKLGLAQYKSRQYEKAYLTFEKVVELRPDYLSNIQYWMQCAHQLENCNTGNQWFALKPSKKIIETWGNKPIAELKKKEIDLLIVAYEVMAYYSFNPTGEDENYHCEDAMPWIEKIYAIDPNYMRIKSVSDYCGQFKNN